MVGKKSVGREGTGHLTHIGLLNLYEANWIKAGGKLFCHKNIHKWTWCTESQWRRCQTNNVIALKETGMC